MLELGDAANIPQHNTASTVVPPHSLNTICYKTYSESEAIRKVRRNVNTEKDEFKGEPSVTWCILENMDNGSWFLLQC
jgi:hypothetical protein